MNFTNTFRIENLTLKINLKAMIIGILITAIFLVASNTNEPAIAQAGSSNTVGCAHTVKVTISDLPNQTSPGSLNVPLSNIGSNNDRGNADITIPGIGSAHLSVSFHIASKRTYGAEISDMPGQNESSSPRHNDIDVCHSDAPHSGGPPHGLIFIPGVVDGFYEMGRTQNTVAAIS